MGAEVIADDTDLPFQIIQRSDYTGLDWLYLEIDPKCYRHPAGTYELEI